MSATRRKERMAGAFVLVAALCVVAFVVGSAIENGWFEARVTFYTQVEQGDGLREGTPVLVSGISVGEVGEMRLGPDGHIRMELRILSQHVARLRKGTVAEVRRVLGVGQKRVHLLVADRKQPALAPGSTVASKEPLDMLSAVADLDLDRHAEMLGKMVDVSERMLVKLDEEDRFERMVRAFDQLPETLDRVNTLLEDGGEPMVELLKDRQLKRAIGGAANVFNDPATMQFVTRAADSIEPEKVKQLVTRMDAAVVRIDALLAEESHFNGVLRNTERLLQDKRVDKTLTAVAGLSDAEKLERLLDNVAVLARESAKVGPEIPKVTRELMLTLREAIVVLRAMQKSWILEDEAEAIRQQMKQKQRKK